MRDLPAIAAALPFGSSNDVFADIALVLLVAALVGAVAVRLHQPLIVAYIVVGVLVGPTGIGLVEPNEAITLLAEIGIALLLFVVGLKLDLGLVRRVGPVAVAAGLGQVVFTSVIGFGIGLALGMSTVTALYVAVALTFSSTVVIVKLLSDKGEIEELHGRIAIGFLIVQDIVVIVVMIALTTFGSSDPDRSLATEVGRVILGASALFVALAVLMRWVLTPLLHRLAHSSELLVLFAIAWAVIFAAIADAVGLSNAVGAFLAGFSLASTPFREAIGARLVSLRDFLLLFFFIDITAAMSFADAWAQVPEALVFSIFVLVGNPLIVMIILGGMRYRKRVSFLAGLTVAQISEFSLILAALGLRLGHIDDDTVTLITIVGLVTIALSTYMIMYSHTLYAAFAPYLGVFERTPPVIGPLTDDDGHRQPEVVVLGLGRYGSRVVEGLVERGMRVLGVDLDPRALARWEERGVDVLYGDLEDPELPTLLPLEGASWVVSTIRRADANLALLHALRHHGYTGRIAVAAHRRADAERLRYAGAHRVLLPYASAAREVVELVTRSDIAPLA